MKKLLFVLLLLVVPAAMAQANDVDPFIELLRSDFRADKKEIVELAMNLSPAESGTFSKIYQEYEVERVKLADHTLELIREFPDAAAVTGPTTIGTLAAKWLKLQDDKNKLAKKYYGKAEKQLSPRVAARWMQVEHRIDLLIDLQIAADTPLITRLPD